ncbi:MAG: L,D-transpeptidase [Pseudomonadota bacterium]
MTLDRRTFLAAGGAATIAGPALAHHTKPFEIPEEWLPRRVRLRAELPAGEIHLIPGDFALYWTEEDRHAIRYAVGIGRGDLYESGTFWIRAKKEWPSWKPTQEMMERDPELYTNFEEGEKYEKGMPGGPGNPLGARALYLFDAAGRDTYLRIHGTNNPRTIGTAVSNGCARLINSHIGHLYDLVPQDTKVVLYPKGWSATIG